MIFFLQGILTSAQQKEITVYSENKPMSAVLNEISERNNLKFAYDAESFQHIVTNFELENVSFHDFLEVLESEYHIKSKLIDGTWVLVAAPSKIAEEREQEPEKPKYSAISGYVKDEQTGEDLLYCNVLAGNNQGGMTNELGFFHIKIPADDSVRLRISHLGYQPFDSMVATDENINVFLKPSEIVMEAIEVRRYEKQVLQASPQPGKIAFNPLKSSNAPRISDDDLANALLLIPGVNFVQGSSAGLSIRGGEPTDNLILFDGIPVLETSHLLGNMSVLNSKFVQQAFVSRGGFDSEFGGRVAGLIQLTGKSGKNNKPYFEVGANLLNTNVLANIPVGNDFSVTAAWRRSFIDQWKNYLYLRLVDDVAGGHDTENTVTSSIYPVIQYEDFNAKVSFHPSEHFEFNLNFLYGSDYQNKDYALLQTKDYFRNEYTDGRNMGFSLNLNWQANNRWFHSFTAGYSTLDKNSVDETGELKEVTEVVENPGQGKGKGKGLLQTKEKTYEKLVRDVDNGFNEVEEYRATWKTEYKTGNLRNQAGIGWTANEYTYNFFASRSAAFIPVDSIINSQSLFMVNAFIQQHISVAGRFGFRWGLRTNTDLTSGKTYWQPRGGIEFEPTNGLNLYFLSGVYNQFLSGVKRIDSEGRYNRIWYLSGNTGIGAVNAFHNILGLKLDKDGWFIDVEGYQKKNSGKLYYFAEPVNAGNEWVISYFQVETAERSLGVDIFLQKRHHIFNHMLGYSVSKTEEMIDGVLNKNWFPAYNDRTHRLKFTEMLNWKNWSLTGSWQFATGLPVIDLNESNDILNPERTPYFGQLDFALTKKIILSNFTINGGASLLNVLDRKNVVEVNYLRFASDREALTMRSDISALAFTPVFFVNIRFN